MTIDNTQFWVFDNEGETWDRYTIILDDGWGTVLGASENPFSPLGFGQHLFEIASTYESMEQYIEDSRKCNNWLGKEIEDISLLPGDVIQFIKQSL